MVYLAGRSHREIHGNLFENCLLSGGYKFFQQKDGMAIGSSLSPSIFMEHLKN
jgi:hypothetical protein